MTIGWSLPGIASAFARRSSLSAFRRALIPSRLASEFGDDVFVGRESAFDVPLRLIGCEAEFDEVCLVAGFERPEFFFFAVIVLSQSVGFLLDLVCVFTNLLRIPGDPSVALFIGWPPREDDQGRKEDATEPVVRSERTKSDPPV